MEPIYIYDKTKKRFTPTRKMPDACNEITADEIGLNHYYNYDFHMNPTRNTVSIIGIARAGCTFKLRLTGKFYMSQSNQVYYIGNFNII